MAKELTGGAYPELLAQASTGTRSAVGHLLRSAYASGLDGVFLLSGIVAVVAGGAVLGLVRHAPARSEQPSAPDTVAAEGLHG
ncbi:hypothetical protein [Nonomuraea sp. NPDC050643]|uniref:hypothetical protein n=1 Tax=Nonomuraea sp. NPDC050643 TaxID=3155660 RepID=UPI0033E14FCD